MEVSWERHHELIKKLLNHHAKVNSQDDYEKGRFWNKLKELLKHTDVNIQLFNHNLMVDSSSTASIEVSKNKSTQIIMEMVNSKT